MRLTTVVVTLVVASIVLRLDPQSQPTPPGQPAILGNFVQGIYSNTVLGLKFELPTDWQIDNLSESEDFSRHLPQRMHLRFKSNEDWILLSASPLDPDENLQEVFDISLKGAIDGGGFHAVGKPATETRKGWEVFSQKLTESSSPDQRLASIEVLPHGVITFQFYTLVRPIQKKTVSESSKV